MPASMSCSSTTRNKSGGNTPSSVKKRTAQADRVKAMYEPLRGNGIEHVVVVGDFNDTPPVSR